MEKQLTLIIDKLINEIGQVQVLGDDKKVITDVTADSRVVENGSLFICLKGATVDGHKFLKMAVEKAQLQLWWKMFLKKSCGVTLLVVPDTRKAMEAVVLSSSITLVKTCVCLVSPVPMVKLLLPTSSVLYCVKQATRLV